MTNVAKTSGYCSACEHDVIVSTKKLTHEQAGKAPTYNHLSALPADKGKAPLVTHAGDEPECQICHPNHPSWLCPKCFDMKNSVLVANKFYDYTKMQHKAEFVGTCDTCEWSGVVATNTITAEQAQKGSGYQSPSFSTYKEMASKDPMVQHLKKNAFWPVVKPVTHSLKGSWDDPNADPLADIKAYQQKLNPPPLLTKDKLEAQIKATWAHAKEVLATSHSVTVSSSTGYQVKHEGSFAQCEVLCCVHTRREQGN